MIDTGGEQLCLLIAAIVLIALFCYRGKWRGSGRAFGTARWASLADLLAAGMIGTRGLILGRTRRGDLIWMPRYTHLSIFAPTSAGKGVSFVVPWLLTFKSGSCVTTDPKGEHYRLTAERRRALGQTVVRLDPFGVCGEGADSFNILDLIGSGPESVDDCRAVAEAMVQRTKGEEKDPHWNDQSANVLTALLTLITTRLQDHERTLSSLREIVTDPELWQKSILHLRDMGGVYARLSGVMAQLEDKERASVLSTIHRHTNFLDSDAILESISRSTFNARELLEGNMTIYLILPPHQLSAQSRWLRLVITALIRLIGRSGTENGKEFLFVLDEAGTALCYMPAIEQGLALMRSYGLKMAFFFQSIGQLAETFPGRESVLLDNTEQIYFGIQSYETAERVSKMLGTATNVLESANESESRSWQRSGGNPQGDGVTVNRSWGQNWAEHGRELLRPEEVLTLNGDYFLAFLRGLPPILARRVKWFEDPEFKATTAMWRQIAGFVWWLLLVMAAGLIAGCMFKWW